MSAKHKKDELNKAIFSGLDNLTENDLDELIKKESAKEPGEVDFDFIDTCMDLLELKTNNRSQSKKVIFKPARVLVAAVLIVIITVLAVSVSAKSIVFNIPEDKAKLVKGNAVIEVELEKMNIYADGYALKGTQLFKKLKENNITPVTFPALMASDECEITNVTFEYEDSAKVDFIYNGFKGCMDVIKYSETTEELYVEASVMGIKSGEMICVNGLEVLVFEQKDRCVAYYTDGRTEYNFDIYCDMDTALEFVKTIK